MTTVKDRLDVESEVLSAQLQKEAEHIIHSMPSSVDFDELWQLHTGGVGKPQEADIGYHRTGSGSSASQLRWLLQLDPLPGSDSSRPRLQRRCASFRSSIICMLKVGIERD